MQSKYKITEAQIRDGCSLAYCLALWWKLESSEHRGKLKTILGMPEGTEGKHPVLIL